MPKIQLTQGGKIVGTLDSDMTTFFTLETCWGNKEYKIEFTHPRDHATHEKDKTKIAGALLNKVE